MRYGILLATLYAKGRCREGGNKMTLLRTMSIASILFMITSGMAHAILSSADLYKEGDGLATYDDQSGLLWLDTSVTVNMSYQEAVAYKYAEGWHIATEEQFDGLIDSMFSEFSANAYGVMYTLSDTETYSQIEQFQDLFGYVYSSRRWPSQEWASMGMYMDGLGNIKLGGANLYTYNNDNPVGFVYGDTQVSYSNSDRAVFNVGTYLVRTKVAEPSSLILLGIGLLVLGYILRRYR